MNPNPSQNKNRLAAAFAAGEAFVRRRSKRILWISVAAVALIHVLALVVFGSMVIFSHVFQREVAFEAPPDIEKRLDPRKIEHQVRIQQQQQRSGRPRVQPRLSAQRVTDFPLPEITTDPKPVTDLMRPDITQFGQAGLGRGTAGGAGIGGLGLGTSQVMVMGLRAQTDRIAILVDLSLSMIEDERGGFPGFEALKQEINDVINALNPGSFFNIIGYGTHVDMFKPEAVLASPEHKREAREWLEPYMTDMVNVQNNGAFRRNFTPEAEAPLLDYNPMDPSTRLDLALAAAFQSGVDTIFIISDGHHNIQMPWTDELRERRDKAEAAWSDRDQQAFERRRREWEEQRRREDERRKARGLPPRAFEGRPPGRQLPGPGIYSDSNVLANIEELAEFFYDDRDKPRPRIYVIGYVPESGAEQFMRRLAREFRGRYRASRALVRPVRS